MRRGLVGLAVVLLLAACGGGGEVTKADYVKRANAVCRAASREIAALPIPDQSEVASMPKVAADLVAVQREALDRLRAIRPPKPDRSEIAKWIALVDQTIDQAELSAASQQDGDFQRATTANVNGAALDARADELARAYGLRMCVHSATPPDTSPPDTSPPDTSPTTTTTTKAGT